MSAQLDLLAASRSRLAGDGLDALVISPRTELTAWRTEARRHQYERIFGEDWNHAGCAFVSDHVHDRLGYPPRRGCYVLDEKTHIQHVWNRMPDGGVFDATADQFGELGDGIRIAPADDPRYLADCPCGGLPTVALWPVDDDGGYVGEWLVKVHW